MFSPGDKVKVGPDADPSAVKIALEPDAEKIYEVVFAKQCDDLSCIEGVAEDGQITSHQHQKIQLAGVPDLYDSEWFVLA